MSCAESDVQAGASGLGRHRDVNRAKKGRISPNSGSCNNALLIAEDNLVNQLLYRPNREVTALETVSEETLDKAQTVELRGGEARGRAEPDEAHCSRKMEPYTNDSVSESRTSHFRNAVR